MTCQKCENCKCREIVVWVNGCFDIMHVGHIRMLKFARSLGDRLVVGLDYDDKVSRDKGPRRPILSLREREEIMQSIEYVDEVCAFSNKQALKNQVEYYKPDIMVVGSDWKGKEIVGSQHAGEIVYFDRIEGYSTTDVIKKIAMLYEKPKNKKT